MLAAIHKTLERVLYEYGGIDSSEVEVSFDQPTRQWADGRLKPTINFFLFDLNEFTELRSSVMQSRVANGRVTQRMPARRFNLNYMTTVWSSETADEHALLWRILAILLRYNPLPESLQPSEVRSLALPLHTMLGRPESMFAGSDMWGALGVPPRPALFYTVVAPLDLDIALEAPMVLASSLRVRQLLPADLIDVPFAPSPADLFDKTVDRIGGVVRDREGRPVAGARVALEGSAEEVRTDTQGRYTLPLRRDGPFRLSVEADGQTPRTIDFDRSSATFDIALD